MEASRININEAHRRTLLIAGAAGLNGGILMADSRVGAVTDMDQMGALDANEQQDKWMKPTTLGENPDAV